VFTHQKVRIKAFEINRKDLNVNQDNYLKDDEFLGVRFDGKNHNWLIIGEYLQLPFSYMTFVIKDRIEKKDKRTENFIFDSYPYNYIFNKSSSFIDGEFVKNDNE